MDLNGPILAPIITRTAAFTLDPLMSGALIFCNFAADATITIPNNLPPGFSVTLTQAGAGIMTYAAASPSTLRNINNHTKSAGQYSMQNILIFTAANPRLSGQTAA